METLRELGSDAVEIVWPDAFAMDASVQNPIDNALYVTTNRLPFLRDGLVEDPLEIAPNFRIVKFLVDDISYLSLD